MKMHLTDTGVVVNFSSYSEYLSKVAMMPMLGYEQVSQEYVFERKKLFGLIPIPRSYICYYQVVYSHKEDKA